MCDMSNKHYENLSEQAQKVMPQIESLLNGLSVKDVFEISRSLKDKVVEETRVIYPISQQHA